MKPGLSRAQDPQGSAVAKRADGETGLFPHSFGMSRMPADPEVPGCVSLLLLPSDFELDCLPGHSGRSSEEEPLAAAVSSGGETASPP